VCCCTPTRPTSCGASVASSVFRRTAYLVGRRVEAARRLLLDGAPIAAVAAAVGFHD